MSSVSISDQEKLVRALPDVLPVLPLQGTVLFPYSIMPLSVSGEKSAVAVDHALADHRMLMLVAQRDPNDEDPSERDLHAVGTAALVVRMLKLPDGRVRILVQGLARASLDYLSHTEPFLAARLSRIAEPAAPDDMESQALVRIVKDQLDEVAGLGRSISSEVMVVATNLQDPRRLADLAASNLELKLEDAQALLETADGLERLRRVSELLQREIHLLQMQQQLSSEARQEMDRSQREYFLRQQLRAIHTELGEGDDLSDEIAAYRAQAAERRLSEEACQELERQLRRLERAHPDSAEGGVIRTFLDWLTTLPWSAVSEDNLDLDHARRVLDEDHYDLRAVKERILEYLAVRKLKGDARGPLLCFIGPPGVGKTSLGRSIARALGREFVRLSLGGVHDEAEIRGHRRTYIGALPGRIIQGVHQARTSNPVFMLDEIDKIGADFRGDPASALLEVLDTEQNGAFRDHYLGVAYDLSKVMFITTGNLIEPIAPAFLDRMELIRLSGYTQAEKLEIAARHLVPRQIEENGLAPRHVSFPRGGLERIIADYTREAGVRGLEREIAAICRKVAMRVARGSEAKIVVNDRRVKRLLGPARHQSDELLDRDRVGVATGLAWTAAGGDLMLIEALSLPGRGELLLTGQLGDVMKESAQAGLSFARSFAAEHDLADRLRRRDVHIHVPAGSIPKDGPSAGVTVATAIVSLISGRAVRRSVAMSGEITLRGEILPVGGVKEKVLAAHAAGVETLVLPRQNERDLREVPPAVRRDLRFRFVDHMAELLEVALIPAPAADP
ncbi:MAG TPA: endopeptidase La, partial [Thermoanaerobaculia bacterium]|nr:endopeptidase La [Thermoanaerobaculia bacterium]